MIFRVRDFRKATTSDVEISDRELKSANRTATRLLDAKGLTRKVSFDHSTSFWVIARVFKEKQGKISCEIVKMFRNLYCKNNRRFIKTLPFVVHCLTKNVDVKVNIS